MTVTKDQNCGCVLLNQRQRLWPDLSSLFPERLLLSQLLDLAPQSAKLTGQITISIGDGRRALFSDLVRGRCIDRVRQEHWLSKEKPIGEKELPAEKGIEQGAREAGISKKKVDAQVATKRWPN